MADRAPPASGVLVIDKPRGPTSHDVVAKIRRLLSTREVGHAGTLDPMATGVLVVAVGEATKLAPYLTSEDKTYEATIALGVATDTLDADGQITERLPLPDLAPPTLAAALEAERHRTEQIPPDYSAIKRDGVRAYALARRGEPTALAPRAVVVRRLVLVSATADTLTVRVEVGKGYYVRALGRDLAAALGTVGHLTALRRLRSGSFAIDEAAPLDALTGRLIPLAAAAARALPVVRLSPDAAADARQGRPLTHLDSAPGPHAWLDDAGHLVAVGEVAPDGRARVLRGFRPPPDDA